MGKITYQIDRLSNNSLEFGLKSGAIITGSATALTLSKPLVFNSDITSSITTDNHVTNKKYVDNVVSGLQTTIYNILKQTYVASGEGISATYGDAAADPKVTIALDAMSNRPANNDFGYADASALHDGVNGNTTNLTGGSKQVVSGIKIDNYGRVIGVYTKEVSTSDLNVTGALDNYVQWNLQIGSTASATTVIPISSGNTAVGADNPVKTYASTADATHTNIVNMKFLEGAGVSITSNTTGTPTITYGAKIDTGDLAFNNDNQITLKSQTFSADVSNAAPSALGLYKILFNQKGIITNWAAVDLSDITTDLTAHSATTDGIVKHLITTGTGTNTESASTTTYFYTSSAKWAQIPYNKVTVAQMPAGDTTYPLLVAGSSDTLVTTLKNNNVTLNQAGTLTATKFHGDGSELTSLNATQLTSGTVPMVRLNSTEIVKLLIPTNFSGTGVVLGDSSNHLSIVTQPSGSTDGNYVLTSTVATSTPGTPHWENISELVKGIVASEGGMIFKGLLKKTAAEGYITALPGTETGNVAKRGWFYRVAESGTYSVTGSSENYKLEAGDAIYCIADGTESVTNHWAVLERNLDDAIVKGVSTAPTSAKVAIIQDTSTALYSAMSATFTSSKWTLDTNISGLAAKATELANSRSFWGQSFNGTGDVTGGLTGANSLIASNAASAGSIGSSAIPYSAIYATAINGHLVGTADEASKVTNVLTISGIGTTPVVYDGSSAQSIDLSSSSLNYIKTITASSGTGNVITGFSTATYNYETGVATLAPTYGYAVTSVTSSILATSTTTGTTTIGWKTTATNGTFYTGNFSSTSSSDVLNYGGVLNSKELQVYRGGLKPVANEIDSNAYASIANDQILVAKADANNSGYYGFTSSGKSIVSTYSAYKNDNNAILTAKATHDLVESVQSSLISSSLQVVKATFAKTATTNIGSIPSGAIIDHIDVYVTTGYSANETATVKIGSTVVIGSTSTNLIDISENDTVYSYKFGKNINTSAESATINLTGATTSSTGSGAVYIYYVK